MSFNLEVSILNVKIKRLTNKKKYVFIKKKHKNIIVNTRGGFVRANTISLYLAQFDVMKFLYVHTINEMFNSRKYL